jgi:hypothetical protein
VLIFFSVIGIRKDDSMLKLAFIASARFTSEEANAVNALVKERAICQLFAVVVPFKMTAPSYC